MKKRIYFILLLIFFVYFGEAYELGVSPQGIEFYGDTGEDICEKAAIFSRNYAGDVSVGDRWALDKNTDVRNYNLSSSDIGLDLSYDRDFEINSNGNENEVCLNAKYGGKYYGVLLFRGEDGSVEVGIWLYANIKGESRSDGPNGVNKIYSAKVNQEISAPIVNDSAEIAGSEYWFDGKYVLNGMTTIMLMLFLVLLVLYLRNQRLTNLLTK